VLNSTFGQVFTQPLKVPLGHFLLGFNFLDFSRKVVQKVGGMIPFKGQSGIFQDIANFSFQGRGLVNHPAHGFDSPDILLLGRNGIEPGEVALDPMDRTGKLLGLVFRPAIFRKDVHNEPDSDRPSGPKPEDWPPNRPFSSPKSPKILNSNTLRPSPKRLPPVPFQFSGTSFQT